MAYLFICDHARKYNSYSIFVYSDLFGFDADFVLTMTVSDYGKLGGTVSYLFVFFFIHLALGGEGKLLPRVKGPPPAAPPNFVLVVLIERRGVCVMPY
jgi:hypothetical protein